MIAKHGSDITSTGGNGAWTLLRRCVQAIFHGQPREPIHREIIQWSFNRPCIKQLASVLCILWLYMNDCDNYGPVEMRAGVRSLASSTETNSSRYGHATIWLPVLLWLTFSQCPLPDVSTTNGLSCILLSPITLVVHNRDKLERIAISSAVMKSDTSIHHSFRRKALFWLTN